MNDKKQIEEMAKTLYDYRFRYDDCVAGSEEMLAKYLIEQGWIKPNENSVVLTMEEKQEYENLVKLLIYDKPIKSRVYEFVKNTKDQARKETAEKILNDLYHREELGFETIKWYAKTYWGIEVK